jgi:uncharacterized protein YbjT (DUF2867 family)
MSESRSILVIGGTGMLGEPVVRCLQADGYTVRVLTRNLDKARRIFGAGVEAIKVMLKMWTHWRLPCVGVWACISISMADLMPIWNDAARSMWPRPHAEQISCG